MTGLGLWNKDKSSELALICFVGVRRWYAGSHQVIAISYRQRLPGPDARKTEIDQATRRWSLLGGVWHEKAEWSSLQIKKISWQANESQHSPNPELLAWCHSLLWSIRPTETDIRNEWAGSDIGQACQEKGTRPRKEHKYIVFYLLQRESAKGYLHRIFESKGRPVYPQSTALLVRNTDMEPRDAVQQQCALNVPWSMRAPAPSLPSAWTVKGHIHHH